MKSSDIHLPLLYREGLCLNNNIVAAVFFSSGSDTKVAGKHSATYKYDNTMFETAYLVFTIEFDKQFLTF